MALQGLAYPATIWTSHGNTLLKRVFSWDIPEKHSGGLKHGKINNLMVDSPAVFDDTRGPLIVNY